MSAPDHIADLVNPANGYLDDEGWLVCEECGSHGYIRKEFKTQEGGTWKPYLKAIIRPG